MMMLHSVSAGMDQALEDLRLAHVCWPLKHPMVSVGSCEMISKIHEMPKIDV